jgi:hypothetical protein
MVQGNPAAVKDSRRFMRIYLVMGLPIVNFLSISYTIPLYAEDHGGRKNY